MPECFNLCIGGITITLIPDQILGEYDLVKRAIDFRSSAKPDISLQIHCGWFPTLSDIEVSFQTDSNWKLFKTNGKWVINLNPDQITPNLLGVFPADFRSGDIYTAQSGDAPNRYYFPLVSPMGELFIMNLLGAGLGMLFHAAGVIDRGNAYLFAGHGSAGKSTTAQLWQDLPDVQVVNDDKIIVRKEAGGYRLYGTPWHGVGGIALPDSAPLKRIFILQKADRNFTRRLQPIQATSNLLTRAFLPLWDAEKMEFTLKFLDELYQSVPCEELGFLPESSVVDFVRNLT
jgi:hypothetical protein